MASPVTSSSSTSVDITDLDHYELHRSTTIEPYHQFKHQSATKHIIDLYFESEAGHSTDSERCKWIQRRIDTINARIRVLNVEHRLPESLGIIDYGAIIQGWKDGGHALRDLCEWKQYVVGWSTVPPTHDYRYLAQCSPYWERSWDIFLPWLQLIWTMHKRRVPHDVLERTEWSFLEYVRGINEAYVRLPLRGDVILAFLHSLSQLLWEMCEAGYDQQREELRRICELSGFPLQSWFPRTFEEELEFRISSP